MHHTHKLLIAGAVAWVMIPVLVLGFFALPWIAIGVGIFLSPGPSKPEVTYAEFPFELVYEIDGETVTITDTVICEYDGIGMNEGVGKYRKWKYRLKNAGSEGLLLTEDAEREIYCYVGDAEYYMNDERYPTGRPLEPHLYDVPKITDVLERESLRPTEIMERYHIKIISWDFSDPIENSFGSATGHETE